MSNLLKLGAFSALALAGLFASAMPVGVKMAMHGRATAQAAVNAAFPELSAAATPADVAEALGAAADDTLVDNITNVAEYAEFREWAKSVGAVTVKSSDTAWLSYVVGAVGVVPMPQDGDLAIDDIVLGSDGKLDAVFSLNGVNIDSAALESRLKTVFGVEGAASLDKNEFSEKNIGLSLMPTRDGRVRARITPPAEAESSFFMRAKVK